MKLFKHKVFSRNNTKMLKLLNSYGLAILRSYGLIAAISICISISAQEKEHNEFIIHIGGGLSSIRYNPLPKINSSEGFAFDFGISYTAFFTDNWGVNFGLEPFFYTVNNHINLNKVTLDLTEKNGQIFNLYTLADYNEKFSLTNLNIPIMLQFQKDIFKNNRSSNSRKRKSKQAFYAMGGIKTAIPINCKYNSEIPSISNSAFYPQVGNWAATQEFAGLGNFEGRKFSEEILNFDISLMLALESGIKWRLDNCNIYTGLYFDYGLNNKFAESRKPIRNFIAVDYLTDFPLIEFSEKAKIMSAGFIVRFAFKMEKSERVCSAYY